MDDNSLKGRDVFIQKQADNQLITDLRNAFIEIYDTCFDAFNNNVLSLADDASDEEYRMAAAKYDYIVKGLEFLKDSFLNIETAFSN